MASVDDYVEQTYPVLCKGRDVDGNEVLEVPVVVKVKIHKPLRSNTISSLVECPHVFGKHGELCRAVNTLKNPRYSCGEDICCRYAIDLPYATDLSIARAQQKS